MVLPEAEPRGILQPRRTPWSQDSVLKVRPRFESHSTSSRLCCSSAHHRDRRCSKRYVSLKAVLVSSTLGRLARPSSRSRKRTARVMPQACADWATSRSWAFAILHGPCSPSPQFVCTDAQGCRGHRTSHRRLYPYRSATPNFTESRRMLLFRRSFSWARLRANSCALQLRLFCFRGSSRTTRFPPIKQSLALGAEASRFWVPQENGAKKEKKQSCLI